MLFVFDTILFVPVIIAAVIARFVYKRYDVGIGPEPLINNVYHKKALEKYGYTAKTFVGETYFITSDFDVRTDTMLPLPFSEVLRYYLYFYSILNFKCLYIYFNGGPLFFTSYLWRLEPLLYHIAKVKIVIMPYGSDIQDMLRCPNLVFRDAVCSDYPDHRLKRNRIQKKIDLWTKHADHIIGGCDWVDYLYHWDTLLLAHFAIDVLDFQPPAIDTQNEADLGRRSIRILHAPNHKKIKGTKFVLDAIHELQEEGYDIDFVLVEKRPNAEVQQIIQTVDLVIDQLIIGWYAMFAIEAMASGKPVISYLRDDLIDLYTVNGLIEPGEVPIINSNPLRIKDDIKYWIKNRNNLQDIGRKSREYVIKHHSLEYVGGVFDGVNRSLGITPTSRDAR